MKQVISKSVKLFLFIIVFQLTGANAQKSFSKNQIQKLKKQTVNLVQSKHKMTQVMIDKVFSFAELGHQEYETSKYLSSILESSGFKIEYGISGMPTAWSKMVLMLKTETFLSIIHFGVETVSGYIFLSGQVGNLIKMAVKDLMLLVQSRLMELNSLPVINI